MSSDDDSAAAEEFKMEVAKKLKIKRGQVAGVRKQARIDLKAALSSMQQRRRTAAT